MEEAKKSGFGNTIDELVSINRCGIEMKESKRKEDFTLDEEVMALVAKFRKVQVGSHVNGIFLWELILNAQQALVIVHMESLVDKKKYGDPPSLGIGIFPDNDNKTLSIIDTGIGMTSNGGMASDDLQSSLISIDGREHIVTRQMESIEEFLTLKDDVGLADVYKKDLWKLGLGFFSAYMVADKVVVTTKKEGHDLYVAEFNANNNGVSVFSFSVDPAAAAAPGGGSFHRGTKVTLHLKKDYHEYLDVDKLKNGAKVNVLAGGTTPLHIAAANGNLKIINILREAGANPDVVDEEGLKAVEVAASQGHIQAVDILLPVTTQVIGYADWSVDGMIDQAQSQTEKTQASGEKTQQSIPPAKRTFDLISMSNDGKETPADNILFHKPTQSPGKKGKAQKIE